MSKAIFTVTHDEARVVAFIEAKQGRVAEAMVEKMTYLMQRLALRIQGTTLSGQMLAVRSGALRESVHGLPATIEGEAIVGRVEYAQGEAWYGRVHLTGGKRMYAINPIGSSQAWKSGQMLGRRFLKFDWNGKLVFLPYVFHPPLPKRDFATPVLEAMKTEIIMGLRQAFVSAIKG